MNEASLVPIGEIVSKVATCDPRSDLAGTSFEYIDISSINRERKRIEGTNKIAAEVAPSRARQVIRAKDILVSSVRPNLNAVAQVPADLESAIASTGFTVLRAREDLVHARYLFHWVRSPHFIASMTEEATGASYPAVSDRIVKESLIPLPPLKEQLAAAAILDKADDLRENRRQTIYKLDTFLQSVFLDMFGDPIKNSKGWRKNPIKELGKVVTGSTPSSELPDMFGGAVPFVTPSDLGKLDDGVNRTLTGEGAKQSRIVRKGSTLVCCIGATIGKMDMARSESSFNQQINAIEWSSLVNDFYGLHVLTFFKSLIAAWGASTTLPILKKSSFEKILLPVPPLDQQERFAVLGVRVTVTKSKLKRSGIRLESLFNALQQRAFRYGRRDDFGGVVKQDSDNQTA